MILLSSYSYAGEADDSARVYKTPSITVTTTRAVERKSTVPFVELSRAEIQSNYTIQDIPQYLNMQPSILTYSQNGNPIGYTNLNMRGFDQRRISVLINGIPQNDPEDHNVYWVDFPDIAESLNSIQIQRGGGTGSYGAAAIGGSINLVTSNFTDNRHIRLSSGIGWQEYGSGDTYEQGVNKYLVEFSSGMVGNYAFYGRLSNVSTKGYRDRSFADLDSYFFSAVRYDENLTTQINLFGGPFSDGLVYNGLPKSYIGNEKLRRKNYSYWIYDNDGKTVLDDWTSERRKEEIEEFSQPHYELLNDWTISEGLHFKSALFYYTGTGFYDYDASWADTSTLRITAANGFHPQQNPGSPLVRAMVENRHGGWIPRLDWDHGNGNLTVGAELRIHRSDHWGKVQYAENLPDDFDPGFKIYDYNGIRDIFSVFGREQYKLTEKIIISAEAQLVRQSYGISDEKAGYQFTEYKDIEGGTVGDGGDLFDVVYWFFNPRLGANWNIDPNNNIFGSVAYTSREPRMRNLYAADDSYFGAQPLFNGDPERGWDFTDPLVSPESMLDFELGWQFRNERMFFSANLYWMEYFDELVKSGRLDIFGNPIDGNAPRTRHFGAELQASAALLNLAGGNLVLGGNATISRNRIIDYDYELFGETISLDDNPIAGFPDLMANISLGYYLGGFGAEISGKFVGEFRSDNFGDMLESDETLIEAMKADSYVGYYSDNKVDPYFVTNANVYYEIEDILSLQGLKLHLQVYNLTNELYAAGAEGKEFFPAAERMIFAGIDLKL